MRSRLKEFDLQDLAILLGLIFLGIGIGLVHLAAGLAVVGVTLLALAVWKM